MVTVCSCYLQPMFQATLDIFLVTAHHLFEKFTLVASGQCPSGYIGDRLKASARHVGSGVAAAVGNATIFQIRRWYGFGKVSGIAESPILTSIHTAYLAF